MEVDDLMATPVVSIVVPTKNRRSLLQDTLSTLLTQDYPVDGYEIVIVDDGSTDDTPALGQSLEATSKLPNVKYIRQRSMGLNAARNTGIELASGDPICFVDDDVFVPRMWLAALVDGIQRHRQAECFGGPIHLRLEGRAPRLCGREPLGDTELDLGDDERRVDAVWGANMAVRRAGLELCGGFDERISIYGDEEEWQQRLKGSGGSIVYLPDAWLWHRRTVEELRMLSLVRARFRRGRNEIRYRVITGLPISIWDEVKAMRRPVLHGLYRGCAWGLLNASIRAGRVWGTLRDAHSVSLESKPEYSEEYMSS